MGQIVSVNYDYQGVLNVQVSLYNKAGAFGVTTECVDYAGALITKCPH